MHPLEQYFIDYATGFFSPDAEIDCNIKLKLAHSLRVKDIAEVLAALENFTPEEAELSFYAALFHDYSRFEQFTRYRTFADMHSFDHGDFSADLLNEHGVLNFLPAEKFAVVEQAIRRHNKAVLPSEHTKIDGIVRDADKLDIIPFLLQHLANPVNSSVTLKMSNEPVISPAVLQSVAARTCAKYTDMHTVADFVVSKIGWIYDLNLASSRTIFREKQYLKQIRSFLPPSPQVDDLIQQAEEYLRA